MDTTDDISIKSFQNNDGFFAHVFNFDKFTKETLLNIVQYASISIIPVIVLNKSMQKFVPEATEDKGSLEILVEIILQIIAIFVGMFIIHRIVTFIPTHGDTPYPKLDITNNVLAMLIVIMSLQSKLGDKVNILVDRVSYIWNGDKESAPPPSNKNAGSAGNQRAVVQHPATRQMSSATTQIQDLPSAGHGPAAVQQQEVPVIAANDYPSDMFSAFR